jgi:carboxyl-terminal processing protease
MDQQRIKGAVMTGNRYSRTTLWLVLVVTIVFSTAGAGFYHKLSADSDETYKGLKVFSDVIEIIQKNYVDPVEPKDLIEKAIQGMVSSLDPHSALLPPEAYEELRIDTEGKFTGIGIHVTMRDGFVTVVSPIEGTPAYKAGIKAMDKIVKVDGLVTSELRDAVKRMRGPKGTTVIITIVRETIKEPLEFTLVRDVIPIESVKSVSMEPGYGYVRITNFREQTTDDVTEALENLESNGNPLKGLVLDLRDNPGGILSQAISVSDLFIEEGIILTIKGRLEKHNNVFKAHPNTTPKNYPIIILINGGSASASEIVAGALKDHQRALLLGTQTFGKGSVQTVESLRDGYGIKFTIARYYTPSGQSIQATGIVPDIIVHKKSVDSSDTPNPVDGLLKEKDLKNHLDAKPLKNTKKQIDEPENDLTQPDAILLENIQNDNQVMRALELLISYDIFKDLTNGK